MTTTEIIYNILSRHHELTVGEIRKKTDFANPKAISNALTRLKKDGRVESVYDEDKGLWLWHIVRESPVASSEAAMRIGDVAAMANKNPASDPREPFRPDKIVVPVHPETGKLVLEDEAVTKGPADHSSHAEEMASDIAEIEQPAASVTTSNVVNHDAECRAKPRKPYTPNKIAGAYSYRGALVIKLDRKAHAKSITLSAKDMAMLASIYGNMS